MSQPEYGHPETWPNRVRQAPPSQFVVERRYRGWYRCAWYVLRRDWPRAATGEYRGYWEMPVGGPYRRESRAIAECQRLAEIWREVDESLPEGTQ